MKEPDNGARKAAKLMIAEALAAKRKAMTLIYVNNWLYTARGIKAIIDVNESLFLARLPKSAGISRQFGLNRPHMAQLLLIPDLPPLESMDAARRAFSAV